MAGTQVCECHPSGKMDDVLQARITCRRFEEGSVTFDDLLWTGAMLKLCCVMFELVIIPGFVNASFDFQLQDLSGRPLSHT
jgi:hypothetical protein